MRPTCLRAGQPMKAGIQEKLTFRSPGKPIAMRLLRYDKAMTCWGAEQYSLTTDSLASWASLSSVPTYAVRSSANTCRRTGLNICNLARPRALASEWTVYSRWCHSTSEADLGSLIRTYVSKALRKVHGPRRFKSSIRRPSRLSIGSIAHIFLRHELCFFSVGCFRRVPMPWGYSREVNWPDMVSLVPRAWATKLGRSLLRAQMLRNVSPGA